MRIPLSTPQTLLAGGMPLASPIVQPATTSDEDCDTTLKELNRATVYFITPHAQRSASGVK